MAVPRVLTIGLLVTRVAAGGMATAATPAVHETACTLELVDVPTVKQVAARCLVASVAAAAGRRHRGIDAIVLARRMPLYPTGGGVFDVQEALSALGYASLAFTADAATIAPIVAEGRPVVAMVKRGTGKHAVVVRGARWSEVGGECTSVPVALQVMDPLDGKVRWRPTAAFEAQQYGQQVLVLAANRADLRKELGPATWERASQEAARFRAQALMRRAFMHPAENQQSLALARRAIDEDPCWDEARSFYLGSLHRLRLVPQPPLPRCGATETP